MFKRIAFLLLLLCSGMLLGGNSRLPLTVRGGFAEAENPDLGRLFIEEGKLAFWPAIFFMFPAEAAVYDDDNQTWNAWTESLPWFCGRWRGTMVWHWINREYDSLRLWWLFCGDFLGGTEPVPVELAGKIAWSQAGIQSKCNFRNGN